MKLTDILAENEIKVDLEAEDKKEAIEELVDLLISEHELSLRNRDEILEVVFKRESSISTGVGGGVAIPHGTVDCINDIIAAMGISSSGIDFDSFDGDPTNIVLLLLVPKNHRPRPRHRSVPAGPNQLSSSNQTASIPTGIGPTRQPTNRSSGAYDQGLFDVNHTRFRVRSQSLCQASRWAWSRNGRGAVPD